MDQSNFATKEDVEKFKKELKEDINGLGKGLGKKIDDLTDIVETMMSATAKSFENVENRLGNVENRLGNVENRLMVIENDIVEVKSQIVFMKDDIKGINATTPSISNFQNHEKRITKLEKSVFAS